MFLFLGATLTLTQPHSDRQQDSSFQGESYSIRPLAPVECYGVGPTRSTATPGSLLCLLILAVSVRIAQVANCEIHQKRLWHKQVSLSPLFIRPAAFFSFYAGPPFSLLLENSFPQQLFFFLLHVRSKSFPLFL